MIQILCPDNKREAIVHCVLAETTSLGVRFYDVDRYMLERDVLKIKSSFGEINVKRIKNPNGSTRIVPEYEECRRIARQMKMPLRVVYETIVKETGDAH